MGTGEQAGVSGHPASQRAWSFGNLAFPKPRAADGGRHAHADRAGGGQARATLRHHGSTVTDSDDGARENRTGPHLALQPTATPQRTGQDRTRGKGEPGAPETQQWPHPQKSRDIRRARPVRGLEPTSAQVEAATRHKTTKAAGGLQVGTGVAGKGAGRVRRSVRPPPPGRLSPSTPS